MKIYFLLLAFLMFSIHSLFAVTAVPWAIEKVQPNGTKISVFLKGDENMHWMESADGYTLMYDKQKYVVYAQTDVQGNLMPSNISFGGGTKPDGNIAKGLRYSKAQINTLMQIDKMTKDATIQRTATGNINALCILAAFSNRTFVRTNAEFDDLMNQIGYTVGGAKGSVKDYYLENSYGLMNLQVTVVGPVMVSHPTSYYDTNSRYREFANEVINLADPIINFSQFANEGQVESFHIIFSGYGDEAIGNGQQIWSHAWTLGSTVTKDGVNLSRYSCSPELRGSNGSNITNIGVIAHELCHVFGSPDYYDVSSNSGGSDFVGTGNWDLMASGSWNDNGRQPASINPYQKIKFGWITPQTLTTGSSVSNMPPSANNSVVYKIAANTIGEHYLLDNKQLVGFDASLPGHGLLIWHIASSVVDNAPNDNHPLQVYPVCASSTTAIPTNTPNSYGNINSAGCPFPGTSGKTEFTDNSTPRAFAWTGLVGIGKPITSIIENADQTVSFVLPGIIGPASACYEGSTFTLDNAPQGTITWTITGSFTVSGNGAVATVTRTGTDTGFGELTVRVDGTVVDSKLVFACPPPSITGPNYITDYMAESYSVNTTYPVYWTVTPVNAPGFQIIAGQNANPAVVSALYGTPVPGSPNGTLTATVTLPDYSTITVSKTIKGVLPITSISAPAPGSITVNSNNPYGTTVSFYASPATSIYYDDYQWSVIPTNSNGYSWHNYGSRLEVTFYQAGSYCITCRFVSSYYTQPYSEQICVSVYNSYNSYGYAAVYPNPASNILNIEIDAETAVQATTSEQTVAGVKAVKREPAYDIRLYDGQGNLLRRSTTKGGKVEFNVSNLTSGIYYLHIYDGVNEKPEIRQIVVER
jgi:M6 family metalloprotease-like protein